MLIVKRNINTFDYDPEMEDAKPHQRHSDADYMSVDYGSEIIDKGRKSIPIRETSIGGSELQDF